MEVSKLDKVIDSIREKIEEEKKANKMLLDNFDDCIEFELGLKIGMEVMHEYHLENEDETGEKDKYP